MEAVFILAVIFGAPVAFVAVRNYYKVKLKELALREQQAPQLEGRQLEERRLLEARIQHLETIVCSVDFELNQRLNRLASGLLEAPAPAPALIGHTPASGPAAPGTPAGRGAPRLPRPVSGGADAMASTAVLSIGSTELAVGASVLGRFTIERELGRGGMGAVFLARDASLGGERVALKVLSAGGGLSPGEMADRFRREVQAARRVTHENVVRIHDLGEQGALLFLSMEYVEGETLLERVRRLGPLPLDQARSILRGVCAGVAAAHAAGVVHRDLKPNNVLLGTGGKNGTPLIKVIDFGLAKLSYREGLTASGLILGTPEYMAPEQVRGQPCDARTDVYALGVMAYHVLTGQTPFRAETPIAVGFLHLSQAPASPRQLRPELPAPLEAAVLRALSKDPGARFPDAAALGEALG